MKISLVARYSIFSLLICCYSHLASSQEDDDEYVHPDAQYAEAVTLNQPLKGYQGIWYSNQASNDEYVYKYGGGLGTYTANHNPLAIFAPEVDKTFFCFGGVNEEGSLIHTISYFDHKNNKLSRPVGVVDKNTNDAHDNPVMSIDSGGYIWLFSTSHGVWRPSYIHKSKKPFDISEFELIRPTKIENGEKVPMDNFSYLQVYYQPKEGFVGLFTYYSDKKLGFGEKMSRNIAWMTSRDGQEWSEWNDLASIEEGHYQTSNYANGKLATSFNYHPNKKDDIGLNYRTNLYYLETKDFGKTWQNAEGKTLDLPLQDVKNEAIVAEYEAEGLKVYINDLTYDLEGNPVILYVTSKGYQNGPVNGPRKWKTARWDGSQWHINDVTNSDNNYDMGSLYVETDGCWRIIGPTEQGPQHYNTGGEMAMWQSKDKGVSWELVKQLTNNSDYNHSYARRPVNAKPSFYAIWADGHGRKPSDSRLYFATKEGKVYRMPVSMKKDLMKIKPIK